MGDLVENFPGVSGVFVLEYDFFVPVHGQFVVGGTDIIYAHGEALFRAGPARFRGGSITEPSQQVREIVLRQLFISQLDRSGILKLVFSSNRLVGCRAQQVLGKQRGAFVVEASAVGKHVIKPYLIGTTGIGLRETQDRG